MNVKQVYDLLKKDIRHRIRQTSKDLSDWEPQEDIVTFGTGLAWLDNNQKTPGTGGIKTFLTGRNDLTYDFIDLDQYYTKDEADKLLDDEKKAREEADQELSDWAKESFVYSISASGESPLTLETTDGTNSDGYKTYSITGSVNCYSKEEIDAMLDNLEDKILEEIPSEVVSSVIAESGSDILVADSPEKATSGDVTVKYSVDEEALKKWLEDNGFDPGSVNTGVTSIKITSKTLEVTPEESQTGDVSINLEYTGGGGGAVDSVLIQHLADDTTEILTIDPITSQTGNVVFNLGIDEDALKKYISETSIDLKYYSENTVGNTHAYPSAQINCDGGVNSVLFQILANPTDSSSTYLLATATSSSSSKTIKLDPTAFYYDGCEVATLCWVESNYYNKQEIDELLAVIQGGESIAPCTWIGYGNNDPSSTGGTIGRSQLMPNSGTPHAGDAILYFHSNYSDNTKIIIATVSSVDGDDVSYIFVTSFEINASSSTSSYKLYSETTSAATIETPDVNYGTISTTWSGGNSNTMTTTCSHNGTIDSLVVINRNGIKVDGDIKVNDYSVLTEADCTKTMLANMISEYEYNNSTSTVINSSASRVTIMEVVGTGQAVNFTMSATSTQAPVSIGRERYIIIHNTGTGTYTYNFNPVSSYHLICTDGNTSLTIQPGEYGEISVISDGTNLYIRSASQS